MVPLVLMLRRAAPIAALPGPNGSRPVQPISISPAALQALLVVAGLGCCVAMSMPQVHIVAYCMDLGYGVARGSEMLSIMLAAGVISRLASGFLADRIGGIRTLLIGSVLQCLSLFFYIPFDGLASLYVVSLVFGLSQGGIVPCYAIIVREYMPASGGRAACRHRHHGDDCRHGDRRLDVRLDLRPDWFLRRRVPQRHRLEHAEHCGDGAAAVEIPARFGGDFLRRGVGEAAYREMRGRAGHFVWTIPCSISQLTDSLDRLERGVARLVAEQALSLGDAAARAAEDVLPGRRRLLLALAAPSIPATAGRRDSAFARTRRPSPRRSRAG